MSVFKLHMVCHLRQVCSDPITHNYCFIVMFLLILPYWLQVYTVEWFELCGSMVTVEWFELRGSMVTVEWFELRGSVVTVEWFELRDSVVTVEWFNAWFSGYCRMVQCVVQWLL